MWRKALFLRRHRRGLLARVPRHAVGRVQGEFADGLDVVVLPQDQQTNTRTTDSREDKRLRARHGKRGNGSSSSSNNNNNNNNRGIRTANSPISVSSMPRISCSSDARR